MKRVSLFLFFILLTAVSVCQAQTTAQDYYNSGIEKYKGKTKDLDGAVADFSKAIELDAKFADAYYFRGVVRGQKQDQDGAVTDFTKTIELDPTKFLAYNNRGFIRHLRQDYDDAIADYSKAIELNPKFAQAYSNRAGAYRDVGKKALAEADEKKAAELAKQPATKETKRPN